MHINRYHVLWFAIGIMIGLISGRMVFYDEKAAESPTASSNKEHTESTSAAGTDEGQRLVELAELFPSELIQRMRKCARVIHLLDQGDTVMARSLLVQDIGITFSTLEAVRKDLPLTPAQFRAVDDIKKYIDEAKANK